MKLTFPPVITLACLIIQILLFNWLPLTVDLSLLFGFLLLVGSIGCIALAARELFKNETTIIPDGQPEKLVTSGPFSFSRNPIYLGMAGILISSACFMQSLSALFIPLIFILIIHKTWIPHEEDKLKEIFGKDWEKYAASTSRWLG
jgi:protein-S-isoprenylcysteine O-methyltransferase Ste14